MLNPCGGPSLIAGSSLMVGSFVAKRFVTRLDATTFRYVMDVVMILAGVSMLWSGMHFA